MGWGDRRLFGIPDQRRAAPCSAMIGTDLEEIAETVEQESGVKATAVKLSGHKAYDAGISETLLALVKLLAKPGVGCAGRGDRYSNQPVGSPGRL